jgi:hypothetical protein
MEVIELKLSNEKIIQRFREQAINEKKEMAKIKEVAEIVNLVGENYSKISARTGYSRDMARIFFARALKLELINDFELINKRKTALKLLKANKDPKQAGLSEGEIELLVTKAKGHFLLSRKFQLQPRLAGSGAKVESAHDDK